MSYNQNYGPTWVVSSKEMMVGILGVIIIFLAPVFPLVYAGWNIGDSLFSNNFGRYIFASLGLGLGYLIILIILEELNRLYVAGFIFLEYFILDIYLTSLNGNESLYMAKIINSIITWGIQ